MPAPAMHIRPSTPQDRPKILEINRLSWSKAYTHIYTHTEMHALFENTSHQRGSWVDYRTHPLQTFVAEIDQQVIGFVGCSLTTLAGHGEVTTLYLHPDFQGRGIGIQLWNQAINQLYQAHCTGAWVWVLERAEARHFYQARGCQLREKGIYRVGDHEETALGYWLNITEKTKGHEA